MPLRFYQSLVFLAALGMIVVASANASTITLSIVNPAGFTGTQWQVFAMDSVGDNGGIFSVGFDIRGATTLQFEGPIATFDNGTTTQQFGFTENLFGTQKDLMNLDPTRIETVAIGQAPSNPAGDYLYGVGQGTVSTGSLTPPAGMTSANLVGGPQSYPSPILLFQGDKTASGIITLSSLNGGTFIRAAQAQVQTFNLQRPFQNQLR